MIAFHARYIVIRDKILKQVLISDIAVSHPQNANADAFIVLFINKITSALIGGAIVVLQLTARLNSLQIKRLCLLCSSNTQIQ